MDTLGDDLILLSIDPKSGRAREVYVLRYGLAGSELIRLVARGLVTISGGRLVVTGGAATGDAATGDAATGDAQLDAALASIAGARRPPTPKGWVARPRRDITPGYLAKLEAAGRIQRAPGAGPKARWWIADQNGVAAVRARLDVIATGTGPVDLEQAAFGGLVHAVQLDRVLYRGWDKRALRRRLKQVAQGKWTEPVVAEASPAAEALAVAIDAAVDAATAAATAANTG
jgi:Golgi phosphoprotein 3 (GPP34)